MVTSCVTGAPAGRRKRNWTCAGVEPRFSAASRVVKKAFETPSAKSRRSKPRGWVPAVRSAALLTPSLSGSPAAPLTPVPLVGSRPKRVSQSSGSPSASPSTTARRRPAELDDLELAGADALEAGQEAVVVERRFPARIRGAGDVHVRAVVGDDQAVGLHRLQHPLHGGREAGEVDVGLAAADGRPSAATRRCCRRDARRGRRSRWWTAR